MRDEPRPSRSPRDVIAREADLTGPDAENVRRLVRSYLLQTEIEKWEHGVGVGAGGVLSARYQHEVDDPASAYAGFHVLLVDIDDEDKAVGVVIVDDAGGAAEIKRLWAEPRARGLGVGSALLTAAIAASNGPVRLSVWEWRIPAIALYESRGFVRVASWDDRKGLICMERRPDAGL